MNGCLCMERHAEIHREHSQRQWFNSQEFLYLEPETYYHELIIGKHTKRLQYAMQPEFI